MLVVYIPDRVERYPGFDLGMLNTLTTRGAQCSTCQLPARLGLTAWVLGSCFAGPRAIRFTIGACFHFASTANGTAVQIVDRDDKDIDSNRLIVGTRHYSRAISFIQRTFIYTYITYYSM